jgi:hypothetical protein
MSYEIVFTEILAGCLFAATAVVLRIRLEKIRSPGLRTKVSRGTSGSVLFRTK